MADPAVVILLHGLARTERSMARLAVFLEAGGLTTWRCTWPSRQLPVAAAAQVVLERLQAELPNRRLMAVTHSLGGALCLHLARHRPIERAVFLAPPMQGSAVARQLKEYKLFQWFYGPAGQEVAQESPWPLPDGLGALAVIAGHRALSLDSPTGWATRALGILQPDVASDGTVALAETRPARHHHFVSLDASHNGILGDAAAHGLALAFLRDGSMEAKTSNVNI